jgi:Protein of unknown function (DUF2917)
MSTQFQVFHGGTFQMRSVTPARINDFGVHRVSEALHLGQLGGDLTVIDGTVWLTRDGDLGDHFIEAGQKLRLGVNENAVIESAHTGQPVVVRWNPRRQSLLGAVLVEPLRGLALFAGLVATGFAALARSAAASASRAQGCIAGGDSIASSGTLK